MWVWIVVCLGIAAIFVVSLVLGRRAHVITAGEAAKWVIFYVFLGVLFGIGIWIFSGSTYAGQFFAGYVTEYALSVDNLFVFAILLAAFRVPRPLQGRVVLIGIGIALVLRGALIAVGAALISTFSWVFYLFGLFLVITAIQVARERHDGEHPPPEPKTVAWMKRTLPLSDDFHGTKFTVRKSGKLLATPLLAVVLALGITDLMFALDSIPAIFGLTQEPFLVFTANAFALLGLSELYFLLGALLQRLRYLSLGLGVILLFIGIKLILQALADNNLPFLNNGEPFSWAPHITPGTSLAVVGGILAVTVGASLVATRRDNRLAASAIDAAGDTPTAPPQDEPGRHSDGRPGRADGQATTGADVADRHPTSPPGER
jgi:tellurite resistance protein TerC